ncbi:MAG TPA: hypothetical protein VFF76_00155 [Holophagaceae bacterium]|jgi:hypothetical protein|nr:hypothetical protein [Holophagaceae bacterium]
MPSDHDFLNKLQIASPCPAAWAEMSGDDRARFCATCEKHVYDFSKMTAAEGMALIIEKEGKVCARLWKRADGTVITADCAVGAMRLVGKRPKRISLFAASLMASALLNLACAPKAPKTEQKAAQLPVPGKPCDPTDKKRTTTTVVVGFAAPTTDTTSATTSMTIDSETWSHLPIP